MACCVLGFHETVIAYHAWMALGMSELVEMHVKSKSDPVEWHQSALFSTALVTGCYIWVAYQIVRFLLRGLMDVLCVFMETLVQAIFVTLKRAPLQSTFSLGIVFAVAVFWIL